MGASSVTGIGNGSAEGKSNISERISKGIPRIVASGYLQLGDSTGEKYNVIFPKTLKDGIDSYAVLIMAENPLPIDGGTDFSGDNYSYHVTKLDGRWTEIEDTWTFDADGVAGGMKGFVIHLGSGNAGGGEGSRDTQVMWLVARIGYDLSEFSDE